jgi:hypothetical protein
VRLIQPSIKLGKAMVIQKTNTSKKEDKNWFMFAMGLNHHLFSDYISLKLLSQIEPTISIPTRFVTMVELVEKSLKLFLAMHEKLDNSLTHYSSKYGHSIEKLRFQAEKFNDVFASTDVKEFTCPFDDKSGALYQHLRYGSQEKIAGFSTNLGQLMPIVEKIFYNCILRHSEADKKMVNNSSLLFHLITHSHLDQSLNPDFSLKAIQANNHYFAEYAAYCETLCNDQKLFLQQQT